MSDPVRPETDDAGGDPPAIAGATAPRAELVPLLDRIVASTTAAALARCDGREFSSFRCGCKVPAVLAASPETERVAFRRAAALGVRRRLEAAWPGRVFDPLAPDVVVEALPDTGGARVIHVPLYVAGRYTKLVRGIAQTAFLCRGCRGRRRRVSDCAHCGGTGRVVPESVADFVVPVVERAARGRRGAFHGAGREDVDVRMLGRGRPFVVSVEDPWHRTIDGGPLAAQVEEASGGRVKVEDLRVVRRADMARLTTDHGTKTYRAAIDATGAASFPEDAAERLARLADAVVRQRTPARVEERRADLVREKRVLGVEVESATDRRIVAVVRTEPGTYVKELVSGDGGRTEPSAAALLGVPCACSELDVLDVATS